MAEDPVPLRGALLEGARRWGIDHPLAAAKVFGSWAELVGPQVAARCSPAGLGRGVLRVEAANPAWANELRYLSPEMIRRVNAAVGADVVREVKVTVAKGSAPAVGGGPGGGPASVGPGPGPVPSPIREASPAVVAEAERLVAPIADERLADATKRALLAAKTRRNKPGG